MISFADLRIRPKLIALLIIFGILPMVCVTLFSGRMASEALIKKSFQELLAIQTLRSASIDTFFEKRLLDIGTLAGTDELRDFATGLTTGVSVNYSIEEV
ncbi:hypothetical protein [Vibrio vulnificus]|nr:hypothetical protein [Vibrio vulnificus]